MRTIRRLLALALVAALALLAGCASTGTPQPSPNVPSSIELVESPKQYDGHTITFTGEVIGEAMHRGDHTWLHLNDDAYYVKNVEEGANLGGYNSGMAVWIPTDQTNELAFFGDYKHEGDIAKIRGVFNAACGQHGGDMDIHATTLAVVTPGHVVTDPIHPVKVMWAIGLTVLAAILYLLLGQGRYPVEAKSR